MMNILFLVVLLISWKTAFVRLRKINSILSLAGYFPPLAAIYPLSVRSFCQVCGVLARVCGVKWQVCGGYTVFPHHTFNQYLQSQNAFYRGCAGLWGSHEGAGFSPLAVKTTPHISKASAKGKNGPVAVWK